MLDESQSPAHFDEELGVETEAPLPERQSLESQLTQLAGQLNAMNFQFLSLLAEFDDQGGWQQDGVKSLSHWLNWKCGIGALAAREKLRVARALPELPGIREAFCRGEISYSKVRAMTRVATPANESLLLQIARHGTAQHVEQVVRKYRRCRQAAQINDALVEPPSFQSWQDDNGVLHLHIRLPADEGELVLQAVEAQLNELRAEEEHTAQGEEPEPTESVSAETPENVSAETSLSFSEGRAVSLSRIAEEYLASHTEQKSQSGAERYQVVLHVNANEAHTDHVIVGGPCCYLDQNRFLAPGVARQLACDASVTVVTEDDQGNTLNVGRRSRKISVALRLALSMRDGGCRYPNCHQTTFTDAHHIHHWADGGETSLDNLITLCRHHHRALHRGEFEIHKSGDNVQFVQPGRKQPIPRGIWPQFPENPESLLDKLDVAIDSTTAVTHWQGESCDYHDAVESLLRLDDNTSKQEVSPA